MGAIKLKLGTENRPKPSNKILDSAVGTWNFLHSFCTSYLRRCAYYAPPFTAIFAEVGLFGYVIQSSADEHCLQCSPAKAEMT